MLNPNIISLIVACYKDERAIPEMYKRVVETFDSLRDYDFELIFVNDGSPDNSAYAIDLIIEQDPRVKMIEHSRNFGSQAAFYSGLELCRGDYISFLDGDLQDPPELIPELVNAADSGFDVVYARRIKREMPLFIEFFYKAFYRIFSVVTPFKVPLDAGDFCLISRECADAMLQFGEQEVFIRGIRAYVGFRSCGVSYFRPERKFGRSTNSLVKNLSWAKYAITSFSTAPLSFLFCSGLVGVVLSSIFILYLVITYLLAPEKAPSGVTSILVLVVFIGSLNFLATAVVGEYVARIFYEVKNRPRFIRKSIKGFGDERV